MLKQPLHFAIVLLEGTRKEDRGPIVLVSNRKKEIIGWITEKRKKEYVRIVKEGSTYQKIAAIDAAWVW